MEKLVQPRHIVAAISKLLDKAAWSESGSPEVRFGVQNATLRDVCITMTSTSDIRRSSVDGLPAKPSSHARSCGLIAALADKIQTIGVIGDQLHRSHRLARSLKILPERPTLR